MTYSTPELLHIGAAQNLVLEDKSEAPVCLNDGAIDDPRSFVPELW